MQPAGPAITMSLSFMGVHVATKFRARGLMSPTAAIRIHTRIYWSVPVIPPYLTWPTIANAHPFAQPTLNRLARGRVRATGPATAPGTVALDNAGGAA